MLRLLLYPLAVAVMALVPLAGQTNTPATNAPAATIPVAIPVADVVSQAQSAITQLQQDRAGLIPDTVLQSVDDKLTGTTRAIDERMTHDAHLIEGNVSLNTLQTAQTAWQGLSDDLATAQKDLSARVAQLNNLLWQKTQLTTQWQATREAAKKASAPAEILQRTDQVIVQTADTTKVIQASLNQLYSMQNRVAAQAVRAAAKQSEIDKALQKAREKLFERDHPWLWDPASLTQPNGGIVAQERQSISAQIVTLHNYIQDKIGAILVNLLLLGLLAMAFHWLRNALQIKAESEACLKNAAQVFDVPMATAVLVALLVAGWLYADAPPLFLAGIGAVALIPAVIIIRRLIEPALFPLLYATVAAYAFDQVRFVIRPGGVLSRALLIFEILAVCVYIIVLLRSRKLATDQAIPSLFSRVGRTYLHAAFIVLIVAGFANVFGYVHLSIPIANGMLQSSYCAVILYAGVRILDAVAISALTVRPLSGLGMVRRHRDLLYRHTSTAIRWAALIAWVVIALQLFTIRDLVWQYIGGALWTKYSWGSITDIQLGPILAFPLTVWAAFLLSRFIRFCLEEEVYPHLQLARGISYATSTVVHYSVLLIGFFIALDALGIDLTKFTVLAGAFAVGLGFGLQNIMNNFISGLILLFERPIKVGDTIQIDANTIGKVERIGIRASVILLTNGSELIMPNGNLISSPVTNWTLSNCERLIEIPVTVTSKVDPQHLLDLLTNVAKAHNSVLKNPPPQAVLTAFGATLVFKLRAWIDSEEDWMKTTSDISLAINAALAKEGITLA